jgi:hypothetical protein
MFDLFTIGTQNKLVPVEKIEAHSDTFLSGKRERFLGRLARSYGNLHGLQPPNLIQSVDDSTFLPFFAECGQT